MRKVIVFLLICTACNHKTSPEPREIKPTTIKFFKSDTFKFYQIQIRTNKGLAAYKQNDKWVIIDCEGALEALLYEQRFMDSVRKAHPYVIINPDRTDTFRFFTPDTIYLGNTKDLDFL